MGESSNLVLLPSDRSFNASYHSVRLLSHIYESIPFHKLVCRQGNDTTNSTQYNTVVHRMILGNLRTLNIFDLRTSTYK